MQTCETTGRSCTMTKGHLTPGLSNSSNTICMLPFLSAFLSSHYNAFLLVSNLILVIILLYMKRNHILIDVCSCIIDLIKMSKLGCECTLGVI